MEKIYLNSACYRMSCHIFCYSTVTLCSDFLRRCFFEKIAICGFLKENTRGTVIAIIYAGQLNLGRLRCRQTCPPWRRRVNSTCIEIRKPGNRAAMDLYRYCLFTHQLWYYLFSNWKLCIQSYETLQIIVEIL